MKRCIFVIIVTTAIIYIFDSTVADLEFKKQETTFFHFAIININIIYK
jgi:hypothetical protein